MDEYIEAGLVALALGVDMWLLVLTVQRLGVLPLG